MLLFLVTMVCWPFGIKLVKYLGASSFIILNMQQRRLYHLLFLSDSSPSFRQIFSREVPCMAPVIAKAFHKKIHFGAGHR